MGNGSRRPKTADWADEPEQPTARADVHFADEAFEKLVAEVPVDVGAPGRSWFHLVMTSVETSRARAVALTWPGSRTRERGRAHARPAGGNGA